MLLTEWKSKIPETMEASEYLARCIDSTSCYYRNSGVGRPTDLGFELTRLSSLSEEIQVPAYGFSTYDEEPEDYPDVVIDFSLWFVSIKRSLYVPNNFHDFIIRRIIPNFCGQRKTCYYQFAVVVLLSESDLVNIKQMSFFPSDLSGKPILDKTVPLMPRDPANYRNYLVARTSNKYHSEEKLFGQCSELTETPFNRLCSAYVDCNHSYPRCILIYSWNFPCSQCTDLIVRSLGEKPYSGVSVVVAHTAIWKLDNDHEKNRKRLESKNITVKCVPYPKPAK